MVASCKDHATASRLVDHGAGRVQGFASIRVLAKAGRKGADDFGVCHMIGRANRKRDQLCGQLRRGQMEGGPHSIQGLESDMRIGRYPKIDADSCAKGRWLGSVR